MVSSKTTSRGCAPWGIVILLFGLVFLFQDLNITTFSFFGIKPLTIAFLLWGILAIWPMR